MSQVKKVSQRGGGGGWTCTLREGSRKPQGLTVNVAARSQRGPRRAVPKEQSGQKSERSGFRVKGKRGISEYSLLEGSRCKVM